jgi:hypothetical protein
VGLGIDVWQGIRRHRIGAGAYTSQRTLRRGFSGALKWAGYAHFRIGPREQWLHVP